jgi:hypothetical protein
MRRLALVAAGALAALACAGTASADPYRFRDRSVTERAVAKEFVSLERRKTHRRYRVRSVGCAKGGVGRIFCAVAATGPDGTETFKVTVSCPDDSGSGCTIRAFPWALP